MKIAVYGGSFNPPHNGHAKAVKDVSAHLHPDRVLIIPVAAPPHKELPSDSPTAQERLEMARIFAGGLPQAEACDIEIARGGKSYTVDTLEGLHVQYPDDRLILLIGADMLIDFEKWYAFRRIMELADIAVFARAAGEDAGILGQTEHLREKYGAAISFVEREPLEISSTELREMLKGRGGNELISDAVYGYIIKRRLYGAKPNLPWLREKSYSCHEPERIPHVQGTEQEAVRLAKRWGCDPGEAAEAGILHDITKKLKTDEQLLLCRKYDIMTDNIEVASPKLLHAKTGAAFARDMFGIGKAVYDAILWHTTGKPDMTLLEKIIYLADYIEPHRNFEGIERLREYAYKDIDAAMIYGLTMSMDEIRGRGNTPHQKSLDALAFFLESRRNGNVKA